jgi:hypothetical protein
VTVRGDVIKRALEQHRLGRAVARDVAEGLDHIAALAERALQQRRLAIRLLRVIAATAENTLYALEDVAGAFAEARKVLERASSRRPRGKRRP